MLVVSSEHGVYLSRGKAREEMSINKAPITHAVVRKGIYYVLLAWVVRCIRHDVMLIS